MIKNTNKFDENIITIITDIIGKNKDSLNINNNTHDKVLKIFADAGYFLLLAPEQYGGKNYSFSQAITFIIHVSKFSPSIGHILGIINFGYAQPILDYGSEQQKEIFLKEIANGELASFAYHENNETIVGQPNTHITNTDNEYILNGQKDMISNIPKSKYALVHVSSGENKTALCVINLLEDGIHCKEAMKLNTLKQVSVSSINFKDVHVSPNQIIGNPEKGFEMIISAMNYVRIASCAVAIGTLSAMIEKTIDMSNFKYLNGRKMSELSSYQFNISNLYAKFKSIETMTNYAAQLIDNNDFEATEYSILSKIHIPELAKEISSELIQYHGGELFLDSNQILDYFSDLQVLSIIGGTTEAMQEYWNFAYLPLKYQDK